MLKDRFQTIKATFNRDRAFQKAVILLGLGTLVVVALVSFLFGNYRLAGRTVVLVVSLGGVCYLSGLFSSTGSVGRRRRRKP